MTCHCGEGVLSLQCIEAYQVLFGHRCLLFHQMIPSKACVVASRPLALCIPLEEVEELSNTYTPHADPDVGLPDIDECRYDPLGRGNMNKHCIMLTNKAKRNILKPCLRNQKLAVVEILQIWGRFSHMTGFPGSPAAYQHMREFLVRTDNPVFWTRWSKRAEVFTLIRMIKGR